MPVPFLNRILSEKAKFINDKIRLAPFYDWGYVGEHNNVYQNPKKFLQSAGVALYITLNEAVTAQLGVGCPLGQKVYDEKSVKFFFALSTEIDRLFLKPKAKERRI